jgi:hypothetical protein
VFRLKIKTILFVVVTLIASSTAMAGPKCTSEPESKWMGMLDMQKKIINDYGFTIKKFKIDGSCYEIYGWEEFKNKVTKIEVYFNPVSGDIVKKEVD